MSYLDPTPPAVGPADRIVVARVLDATEAEGPGRRTAIWVQGCSVRCPGCFNPHLWAATPSAARATAAFCDELLGRARRAGAEGVTLLGGEPFDQAAALAVVSARAQAEGLGVMTFTGYARETLRAWSSSRSDIAALLAHTDLLVDGPYDRSQPDNNRPWVGSTNQGLHHLTARYTHRPPVEDRLEIRVDIDGTVSANGWATDDHLDALLRDLGRREDRPSRQQST